MATPRALILRAPGINRDEDAAAAVELAGGRAERVHVNRLVEGTARLADYAMLIVPGGFSYGDHLGAGKLLAVDLICQLGESLAAFIADGRPVLGICNGFQALVKAGLLPGTIDDAQTPANEPGAPSEAQAVSSQKSGGKGELEGGCPPPNHPPPQRIEKIPQAGRSPLVTLTDNVSGQFECRWVRLAADPTSRCVFTRGIEQPIEVPVAHGEGRFVARDEGVLRALRAGGMVALRYTAGDAEPGYPDNPNGSDDAIAGICNAAGTVLGLMPHPEDAIVPTQHPRWTRQPWRRHGDGLAIFQNAVRYAASL